MSAVGFDGDHCEVVELEPGSVIARCQKPGSQSAAILSPVMTDFERTRGPYVITTDPRRFDIDALHDYLSHSYWAEEIPRAIVEKAVAGSLGFALLFEKHQIGFARVITDGATFAYLCDVYVLEEYRGQGLGKWLIGELKSHPRLTGLRRFVLATRDAHGLYAQFGFTPLKHPESFMEIARADFYKQNGGTWPIDVSPNSPLC